MEEGILGFGGPALRALDVLIEKGTLGAMVVILLFICALLGWRLSVCYRNRIEHLKDHEK